MKIFRGIQFLKTIDNATKPRIIQIYLGRAGSKKIDTGLPDLGAETIFRKYVGQYFLVNCALFGGMFFLLLSITLIIRLITSATSWPHETGPLLSFLISLTLLLLLVALLIKCIYWGTRKAVLTANYSEKKLAPNDLARLKILKEKNADVFQKINKCDISNYRELANLIINLRYELAYKEKARSL